MIVRMKKYDLVLFRGQKDDFLERLQELGLVDITTTGWEPDDDERELMLSIDRHRAAVTRLREFAGREGFVPGERYDSAQQAWDAYSHTAHEIDAIDSRIAQLEKEVSEVSVWGEFDLPALEALDEAGVKLRYFSTFAREFEIQAPAWSQEHDVVKISERDGTAYFVVVAGPEDEVAINAQELRPPMETASSIARKIKDLVEEKEQWSAGLSRAAASVDLIEEHAGAESEKLQISQAARSGREEAEGSLVIMEGWATRETEAKVDAMLAEYPYLYYEKSDPTPKDDTPTLLRNSKFNRMFELIGGFYSLPKYGTTDLTRFFGPFYALFFGLCLADAGYGLLYFVVGLVMRRKLKPEMKGLGNLVTLLGLSTIVCGTLLDSFFGMAITGFAPLSGLRDYVFVSGEDESNYKFIKLALSLGVIQILLAMCIKAYTRAKMFGFRYALSTIGWMLVIVMGVLYLGLPMLLGSDDPLISLPVCIAGIGVGVFMMLFLNSPGKNPLVNFGAGLWNTYNDVTGFMSDFLSYIRLFAIGLAGGSLALVFNQLAVGMSPDIPVVGQIVMIAILLVGHSLNFFMSSLSSFVHPMRLTFVEFYNNAGFEATQREFTPLKKQKRENEQ